MPESSSIDLRAFLDHIRVFLDDFEKLTFLNDDETATGLGEAVISLRERYRDVSRSDADGRPVIIATLYGPTGAGKSALFRLLTGLESPSTGIMRPVTRWPFAAIPRDLAQKIDPATLFPDFTLHRMASPEDVSSQTNQPSDVVFYAQYEPSEPNRKVSLVLIDAPDFNSAELKNREKAESMLRRSSLAIYVSQGDQYLTNENLSELARCCRLSGDMCVVLTKLENFEECGHAIRAHLLTALKDDGRFAETRFTGDTLLSFLEQCRMYGCEYEKNFKAVRNPDVIKPICKSGPLLTSLLHGQTGEQVLIASMCQPLRICLHNAQNLIIRKNRQRKDRRDKLNKVVEDINQTVDGIVEDEWPISLFYKVLGESLEKKRSPLVGQVASPFVAVERSVRTLMSVSHSMLRWIRSAPPKQVLTQKEHEVDAVLSKVESLHQTWREKFKSECSPSGLLSADACDRVKALLQEAISDSVGAQEGQDEWKPAVRRDMDAWVRENPWRAFWLANSGDFKAVMGCLVGVAIGADLVLTGGFVGTIGQLTITGAGMGAAAAFNDFLKAAKLNEIAVDFARRWRHSRAALLKDRFEQCYKSGMFKAWHDEIHVLDSVRLLDDQSPLRRLEVAISKHAKRT